MAVQSSTKKWVFIGGGVIVAAALVVLFQNYPPQSKDAAGTIGAAQRYHEPQITGADVKVSQDELTTWIQSDTFDRIVKDPQARKLFTDAAVIAKFQADATRIQVGPDQARELADGDAVKVKRLLSPADADAAMRRQILPPNGDLARKVDFVVTQDLARQLAPALDAENLRKLNVAFEGANGSQTKLHLILSPDEARRLQAALEGPMDGMSKNLAVDADFARSFAKAVDGARTLEIAMNNQAIKMAMDRTDFVRIFADNPGLADGLVRFARSLDSASEPQ